MLLKIFFAVLLSSIINQWSLSQSHNSLDQLGIFALSFENIPNDQLELLHHLTYLNDYDHYHDNELNLKPFETGAESSPEQILFEPKQIKVSKQNFLSLESNKISFDHFFHLGYQSLKAIPNINNNKFFIQYYLLGLFNFDDPLSSSVELNSLTLFLKQINGDPQTFIGLSNSSITLIPVNDHCTSDSNTLTNDITKALMSFNVTDSSSVIGIVGCSCSSTSITVYNLLNGVGIPLSLSPPPTNNNNPSLILRGIPIIGYSATSASLSDSAVYPNYVRVVSNDYFIASSLFNIINYYQWNEIGILHTTDDFGANFVNVFEQISQLNNHLVNIQIDIPLIVPNGFNASNTTNLFTSINKQIVNSLINNDHNIRVIIIACNTNSILGAVLDSLFLNSFYGSGYAIFLTSSSIAEVVNAVGISSQQAAGRLSVAQGSLIVTQGPLANIPSTILFNYAIQSAYSLSSATVSSSYFSIFAADSLFLLAEALRQANLFIFYNTTAANNNNNNLIANMNAQCPISSLSSSSTPSSSCLMFLLRNVVARGSSGNVSILTGYNDRVNPSMVVANVVQLNQNLVYNIPVNNQVNSYYNNPVANTRPIFTVVFSIYGSGNFSVIPTSSSSGNSIIWPGGSTSPPSLRTYTMVFLVRSFSLGQLWGAELALIDLASSHFLTNGNQLNVVQVPSYCGPQDGLLTSQILQNFSSSLIALFVDCSNSIPLVNDVITNFYNNHLIPSLIPIISGAGATTFSSPQLYPALVRVGPPSSLAVLSGALYFYSLGIRQVVVYGSNDIVGIVGLSDFAARSLNIGLTIVAFEFLSAPTFDINSTRASLNYYKSIGIRSFLFYVSTGAMFEQLTYILYSLGMYGPDYLISSANFPAPTTVKNLSQYLTVLIGSVIVPRRNLPSLTVGPFGLRVAQNFNVSLAIAINPQSYTPNDVFQQASYGYDAVYLIANALNLNLSQSLTNNPFSSFMSAIRSTKFNSSSSGPFEIQAGSNDRLDTASYSIAAFSPSGPNIPLVTQTHTVVNNVSGIISIPGSFDPATNSPIIFPGGGPQTNRNGPPLACLPGTAPTLVHFPLDVPIVNNASVVYPMQAICVPCSAGFYSVLNSRTLGCVPCPTNSICPYASPIPFSNTDKWTLGPSSIYFPFSGDLADPNSILTLNIAIACTFGLLFLIVLIVIIIMHKCVKGGDSCLNAFLMKIDFMATEHSVDEGDPILYKSNWIGGLFSLFALVASLLIIVYYVVDYELDRFSSFSSTTLGIDPVGFNPNGVSHSLNSYNPSQVLVIVSFVGMDSLTQCPSLCNSLTTSGITNDLNVFCISRSYTGNLTCEATLTLQSSFQSAAIVWPLSMSLALSLPSVRSRAIYWETHSILNNQRFNSMFSNVIFPTIATDLLSGVSYSSNSIGSNSGVFYGTNPTLLSILLQPTIFSDENSQLTSGYLAFYDRQTAGDVITNYNYINATNPNNTLNSISNINYAPINFTSAYGAPSFVNFVPYYTTNLPGTSVVIQLTRSSSTQRIVITQTLTIGVLVAAISALVSSAFSLSGIFMGQTEDYLQEKVTLNGMNGDDSSKSSKDRLKIARDSDLLIDNQKINPVVPTPNLEMQLVPSNHNLKASNNHNHNPVMERKGSQFHSPISPQFNAFNKRDSKLNVNHQTPRSSSFNSTNEDDVNISRYHKTSVVDISTS